MRLFLFILSFLALISVGGCDFWPKELKPLAKSIDQQISGKSTAWLVSGDTLIINVAGSPLYHSERAELQAQTTEIARQAISHSEVSLEAIVITFHESEISEDEDAMREFVYLVTDNQPVLQPNVDFNAQGPITDEELEALVGGLEDSLTETQRGCVSDHARASAQEAGDPNELNPNDYQFLTAATWSGLDAFGRRLIFAQAILTEALFDCTEP